MKANLFKCFLPIAWMYGNKHGVSAFIHPDGIYDDPKGGALRVEVYQRLRQHVQYENELSLFEGTNDHGRMRFSTNIYKNGVKGFKFDTISNVFSPNTIDKCYEGIRVNDIPGIKDDNGNWNLDGHPDRIIRIGEHQLQLFSALFDGSEDWKKARLPALHSSKDLEVLECFAKNKEKLSEREDKVISIMWNETNATNDGTIVRSVGFPVNNEGIYQGPHIFVGNPLFKTSRRVCVFNGDYDNIDLTNIPDQYYSRCNYVPGISHDKYYSMISDTPWGTKYSGEYRVVSREMANLSGERTLISAIIPPAMGHIYTLCGIAMRDSTELAYFAGLLASLPFDYYFRITGKGHINSDTLNRFPLLPNSETKNSIILRCLLLNCLTASYSSLWKKCFNPEFVRDRWAKDDQRLKNDVFICLSEEWNSHIPLRTDYERRQALVEIDVLVAMALGMSLSQLITIYRIQFPVLRAYDTDTWYDTNGRITFTNNRGLTGVGFERKEWENEIKGAQVGKKFYRTISDDTMPGGPMERTIEYAAPFDLCDREHDYEMAWRFFAKKYRKE